MQKKLIDIILTQKNIEWVIPHLIAIFAVLGIVWMLRNIFNHKTKMKIFWKLLVFGLGWVASFFVMYFTKIKFDSYVYITLSIIYSAVASYLYTNGKVVLGFMKAIFNKFFGGSNGKK